MKDKSKQKKGEELSNTTIWKTARGKSPGRKS